MSSNSLNKNNSAVKRIMQEARELANDPCTDYTASPLEDDIFEWHCTIRGPAGTEFEGGLYHFRIILPAEYPFRPPSIMMLTPNGRFELNSKICISFTNYHEELWQPAWGVRTAIIGLQGFFPLKGQAAVGVGSIEYPAAERKRLAGLSRHWSCPQCNQTNLELLPDPVVPTETPGNNHTVAHDSETPASGSLGPAEPPLADVSTADEPSQSNLQSTQSDKELVPTPTTSRNAFDTRGQADAPPAATSPPVRATRISSEKPPLFLDAAICVLLVLSFAIICRRMV